MGNDEAVLIMAALGQATRLQAFRLLVQAGPDGMIASEIADTLGVPRNTMSTHFNILARAGLITSRRASRMIYYRANIPRLADLTGFLVQGCCGGRSELCEPFLTEIKTLGGLTPADSDA